MYPLISTLHIIECLVLRVERILVVTYRGDHQRDEQSALREFPEVSSIQQESQRKEDSHGATYKLIQV